MIWRTKLGFQALGEECETRGEAPSLVAAHRMGSDSGYSNVEYGSSIV
jgi:hypothetical protein